MLAKNEATALQAPAQDRATEATRKLKKALGLQDLAVADQKRLSTAIAEVAAEEASSHPEFAKRILALYEALAPSKKSKGEKSTYIGEDLVPISSTIGYHINVYGPPEPDILLKIYGKEQLPKALSLFKPAKLKEAVIQLMQERPGTKPKTKTKAEDLINYIIEQVASGA